MGIPSSSTSTLFRRSCRAIPCSYSSRRTRRPKRSEVTEPRSPGEERLARLAEPEKDVASGTRTLVVGPYLTRRRAGGGRPLASAEGANPRPPEARLDEASGLAAAIDLQIVASLLA